MKFGNFDIQIARDAKGNPVYTLYDMVTEAVMPGSWTSMTAAMLRAAEVEMERRQGVPRLMAGI